MRSLGGFTKKQISFRYCLFTDDSGLKKFICNYCKNLLFNLFCGCLSLSFPHSRMMSLGSFSKAFCADRLSVLKALEERVFS